MCICIDIYIPAHITYTPRCATEIWYISPVDLGRHRALRNE